MRTTFLQMNSEELPLPANDCQSSRNFYKRVKMVSFENVVDSDILESEEMKKNDGIAQKGNIRLK